MRRMLGVVAVGLALSMAAATAQAQTVDEIVKRGKIVIGTVTGAPPFGMIDEKGNPSGYDIDVANLIGKYLGVQVEIAPQTTAARIPSLQAHKVDMLVATLAPTPERAKQVMFTMPYNAFQMMIMAPKSTKITSLDDLKGLNVSVPRGGTQDVALSRMTIPGMTVKRFDDDATAAQALISKQVDAEGIPNIFAKEIMKQHPEADLELKFSFILQPNSMTVRRDQTDLHQWLNNFIYFTKLNGELDALHRKWVGEPLPDLPVF